MRDPEGKPAVAKIIISREARVLQEVELSKARMTIGRHAHNDIVIEDRAVSGEHAAITIGAGNAVLEDLGSTNGTFVNGQRITRHQLADLDRLTVAKFQIEYLADAQPAARAVPLAVGRIEVINGANAGHTMQLTKPLTTLGIPGKLVLVISRNADGYYVARVEGDAPVLLNGRSIDAVPGRLCDGDQLELSGTQLRFSLPAS